MTNCFKMSLEDFIQKPDEFVEEKKIGEGNFSSVYLVHHKDDINYKIALKKIPYDQDDKELSLHFIREVSIMSRLDHPCLVKLIGFSFPSKKDPICKIYSEYMQNNTLKEILKKEKNGEKILSPTHKSIIVYGIASGMMYLHQNKIVHRDLKPENVFLDDEYQPVLSDFGLSRFIGSDFNMTGKLGTPFYMAPELFDSDIKNIDNKIDVYAYAVTILSLFTIDYVFKGTQPTSIRNLVSYIKSGKRYVIPSKTPEFYKDLINDCWSNNKDERPSFEEIVQKLEQNDDFIFEGADEEKVRDYIEHSKKFNNSYCSVNSDEENNAEVTEEFDFG